MEKAGQMEIRVANKGDYAAFTRLELEVHRLHVVNEPWLFCLPETGYLWEQADYEAMLENDDMELFLAVEAARPVGYAFALLRNRPPRPIIVPKRICSIESIGVTANCQGKGVGRALMDAVRAWAEQNGAEELDLSVHAFNQQAIHFYESLGFETYTLRMHKLLNHPDRRGG